MCIQVPCVYLLSAASTVIRNIYALVYTVADSLISNQGLFNQNTSRQIKSGDMFPLILLNSTPVHTCSSNSPFVKVGPFIPPRLILGNIILPHPDLVSPYFPYPGTIPDTHNSRPTDSGTRRHSRKVGLIINTFCWTDEYESFTVLY